MKPIESNLFTQGIGKVNQNIQQNNPVTASEVQESFANELKNAINSVNSTQQESNAQTNALINGEADDLHNVMISAEKASVTLQTATEIQNKAIEAYQKIMRMQL
ncbi:flagellar hook-basal body complex protein FliE [Alkalibacillus silvisoli]|uniref:Flagellar hook-basal body complex protein FliE n=1 Tax=Alkalibacillus silvisoli TaxID=392823 RepID=A0ABP3JQB5_9BACI